MTAIYRYQPVITEGPNGTDFRPRPEASDSAAGAAITDLAVMDGWRYVAVADGAVVVVPEQIETWEQVILTGELRDALKESSPHCQIARDQFIERVRERYSIDDELYFARIATGKLMGVYEFKTGETDELVLYQQHIEHARLDLHGRYRELGLTAAGIEA